MNENNFKLDGDLASEKQKKYLKNLSPKKRISVSKRKLERMTREDASKAINTLIVGG